MVPDHSLIHSLSLWGHLEQQSTEHKEALHVVVKIPDSGATPPVFEFWLYDLPAA